MTSLEPNPRPSLRKIFVIITLIICSIAFHLCVSAFRFVTKATPVNGIVVDNIPSSDSDALAPVAQYVFNGEQYIKKSKVSVDPSYEIGDTIQVYVHPSNPEKAKIGFMDIWFFPGFVTFFAVIFLLITSKLFPSRKRYFFYPSLGRKKSSTSLSDTNSHLTHDLSLSGKSSKVSIIVVMFIVVFVSNVVAVLYLTSR